jgi:hypothetical protein
LSVEQAIPLIDQGGDALERGDIDAYMALIESHAHPDCEFTSSVLGVVEGSGYRGHEGYRRWATDLLETSEVAYREREYTVISDDVLLLLAQFEMKGRESRAPVRRELGVVHQFEDGLLRRSTSYLSHAEALAAAEELAG